MAALPFTNGDRSILKPPASDTSNPPRVIKVDPDGIPVELTIRHQFVCWQWQIDDGEWKKIPIDPNNDRNAKSNNPATWGTFSEAFEKYQDRKLSGISYALAKDDPYTIIDLDSCIDLDTGELSDLAQSVLELFPSTYIERSPSATGLHIIVKAELPGGGKSLTTPGGKIEIYDQKRVMTFTGYVWNDAEISEGQDGINELLALYGPVVAPPTPMPDRTYASASSSDDERRLRMARNSDHGDEFSDLFDRGDMSRFKNDESRADQSLCNRLAFWFDANPSRIDQMFRRSSLIRDKWDKVHRHDGATYGQMTIENAVQACQNPWQPRVELHILPKPSANGTKSNDESEPETEEILTGLALTDMGNAERLAMNEESNIRYCHETDRWYIWNKIRFAEDRSGHIVARAKKTVRSIFGEAALETDPEQRKRIVKHEQKSEESARLTAMISLTRSEPGIPVSAADLDCDHWLLNVKNGTIDLRTGELRKHSQLDMITKLAPVAYDNTAQCPLFLEFLSRVMGNDESLITFLQRAIGYSLTASTIERIILILYGEGKNGKSTLLEVIRATLGDYALRTPTETLLAKRDQGIPNDVARLRGMRFISASEAEEGQRLAEAKIKDLTGGDMISARFMRGEFFDFMPTFKIWLSTNHKPVIRGTDRAIWDRIRLVPFVVRIPPEEQDKHLRDKLISEAPGILAWAVRGCLDWQREGLTEPKGVTAATEGYRAEMDVLGGFISECCVVEPLETVTVYELYVSYQKWCEASGEFYLTKNIFGKRISEKGFDNYQAPGKMRPWTWIGIGLRDNSNED